MEFQLAASNRSRPGLRSLTSQEQAPQTKAQACAINFGPSSFCERAANILPRPKMGQAMGPDGAAAGFSPPKRMRTSICSAGSSREMRTTENAKRTGNVERNCGSSGAGGGNSSVASVFLSSAARRPATAASSDF